jgi:hypothetical protein
MNLTIFANFPVNIFRVGLSEHRDRSRIKACRHIVERSLARLEHDRHVPVLAPNLRQQR